MSTNLPPVPHQAPISDRGLLITPVWSDWFKQIFARVGKNIALSNLELKALFPVTTANIASAAVTLAKLASDATDFLVPTGSIVAYGGSSAPTGFLLCDGSAVSRTTYSALFTAIGTNYGSGDGSTTFNIPNTKGVFLRGAGSQSIGGITYSATLGSSQGDQMQGHVHGYRDPGASAVSAGTGLDAWNGSSTVNTGSPASDGTNGTPRTGSETRPANVSMNWMIKT